MAFVKQALYEGTGGQMACLAGGSALSITSMIDMQVCCSYFSPSAFELVNKPYF